MYWDTSGDLSFTGDPLILADQYTGYMTCWGSVELDAARYGASDHNLTTCVRRLTALLEPPPNYSPSIHELEIGRIRSDMDWLVPKGPRPVAGKPSAVSKDTDILYRAFDHHRTSSQRDWFGTHHGFLSLVREGIALELEDSTELIDLVDRRHNEPHPKRMLREHAWRELLTEGSVSDSIWGRDVLYKLKLMEWSKPGKYARAVGDLGVGMSLQGAFTVEALKVGMCKDWVIGDATMMVVKSCSYDRMKGVFDELIDPTHKYAFAIFSDDSCMSVRTPTGVRRYNLDISSCDASHVATFDALIEATPPDYRENMRTLVAQCGLKARIVSTQSGDVKTSIQFPTPRLFSGSTITTIINNLASMCISQAIVEARAETPDQIVTAALSVGYIVTIDVCDNVEDLQFLKHSPVSVGGVYEPILNIGVLLRSIGRCKRDLPGKGDFRKRAEAFQHAVVYGMYPNVSFTFRDNLIAATKSSLSEKLLAIVLDEHKYHSLGSRPALRVTDDDLYRRYSLTPDQIGYLNEQVGLAGYGYFHHADVLTQILMKDYGYGTTGTV